MAWQNVTVVAGNPTKALELNTVQANITAQANGDNGAPKNKLNSMGAGSVNNSVIVDGAVSAEKLNLQSILLRTEEYSFDGQAAVGTIVKTDFFYFTLNLLTSDTLPALYCTWENGLNGNVSGSRISYRVTITNETRDMENIDGLAPKVNETLPAGQIYFKVRLDFYKFESGGSGNDVYGSFRIYERRVTSV